MATSFNTKDTTGFRYERKFLISELTRKELEAIVRGNPARFSQIYERRYINNIYLDSFLFDHYQDSVQGATERTKVRMRWYGDLFGPIENPALEVKRKNNFLVSKQSFPLNSCDRAFTGKMLEDVLRESNLPLHIKFVVSTVEPNLLNRYQRTYWLSANRKYRLTIDCGMVFYSIK